MRRAPEGPALWTPAGVSPQTPEMLTHLCFACGRDGGFGAFTVHYAEKTGPP